MDTLWTIFGMSQQVWKKEVSDMPGKSAMDIDITEELVKVFVVGDFGMGKSVFGSTFPTPGFVFDFDDCKKIYRGLDFDYVNFPLSPEGWVEFEKIYREVKKDVAEGVYKTICFESCSSFSDLAMERALQLDPKRSSTGGPLWNVHYQMVRNLAEPKLRDITNWPCNVMMAAHHSVLLDADTGAVMNIEPMLTGQLSVKVPGYFSEVYCAFSGMKEGSPYYYLRTVNLGLYKARSHISGKRRLLPDNIPNSYQALMKAYGEGVDRERERLAKIREAQEQKEEQHGES